MLLNEDIFGSDQHLSKHKTIGAYPVEESKVRKDSSASAVTSQAAL
jgi:hypothetical protein